MRERVRDARVDLDLTQAKLAEQAGVSTVTIVRAERGDPISPLAQARIARALGFPRKQLFEPAEEAV